MSEQVEQQTDSMILLPLGISNKLIKKHFPEKVVTNEFKKEFAKALSLFILFTQNSIDKKKYSRQDLLSALDKEGLGRIAQDLRNHSQVPTQVNSPKPVVQAQEPQQMKEE